MFKILFRFPKYQRPNIMARRNKLDMKSSQTGMKQRCRELGLVVYGDKQALLTRIVNEENRGTTDRQVNDSDTDQKMLCTFNGTESLPTMSNIPCQQRQTESTAEIKGDVERCSEVRQWYKNHSGECLRRNSGDKTERTLAWWLFNARSRRGQGLADTPNGRKLTASETAHLNNIMATQRPKSKTVATQRPKPSISKRRHQKSIKDESECCNQSRNWYINHSGKPPRQSSDHKTEASPALGLNRALISRTRAIRRVFHGEPSGRELTAAETAQLNNIMATQRPQSKTRSSLAQTQILQGDTTASASSVGNTVTDLKPCPGGFEPLEPSTSFSQEPAHDFWKRCNELRHWCMQHPGERPRRRSDNKTEASLAIWLERALLRRASAWNKSAHYRRNGASEQHCASIAGTTNIHEHH